LSKVPPLAIAYTSANPSTKIAISSATNKICLFHQYTEQRALHLERLWDRGNSNLFNIAIHLITFWRDKSLAAISRILSLKSKFNLIKTTKERSLEHLVLLSTWD
jgi:hypothetical protein